MAAAYSLAVVFLPFFRVILDPQQRARPKFGKRAHPPFVYLPDRDGVERVHPPSPVFTCDYQSRVSKHVDMLHHSVPRHIRKSPDDLRRGSRPFPQSVKDRAPRRVRKGLPDLICVFCHQVYDVAAADPAKSDFSDSRRFFQPSPIPSRWSSAIMPIAR